MPEFKFVINGTTLSCLNDDSLTTGNVGTYKCSFIFADGLQGMTWFAAFKKNGRQRCAEIENGSCEIPQNMLDDSGTLYVGVFASMLNDPSQYKRLSTNFVMLKVNCGAYDDFLPGAPSFWERTMMKINAHMENGILDHPDGSVTWDKLDEGVQAAINDKSLINNLTDGTEPNSLQTQNSQAISEGTVALGKNSIAGSKCFNITAFDDTNKSYTLDSVEGLKVGDVYSLKLDYIYDNKGTITAINGNVVTVDNYQPDENADKYFRVVSKPTCGTTDFGINAFAEGEECMAVGDNSHASGLKTRAEGKYAHTEGKETVAHSAGHSEGVKCEARGYASHAEGEETLASKPQAHAEGVKTQANGQASHADGMYGKANGKAARVSGYGCIANGDYSEAGGVNTEANGEHSRANGYGCKANGKGSCAVGRYTAANGEYSNVRGKLNEVDNDNKYAEIVGNGDASKRSNAYTLDWNGNAWYSGEVEDGKGNKLSEKAQKNETSNALKGVKGGTSVLVDDVSPITHDVGVVVNMPNTLEYPYKETSHAWGGITFTDNGDGSITANGTATTWVNFMLAKSEVFPNGTYILTGCPKGVSGCDVNVALYRDSSTTAFKQVIDSGNGSPEFNFDGVDYDSYNIKITIKTGTVCDNLTFRPKLCVSPTTTTLTVKNENDEVQATYTPNADGSASGVKSVYPVMKLELSDTTADMTVEYNKDINTALSDKADVADISNITDSVDKLNSKKADKSNSYFGFEGGGGAFAKAGGAVGESAIAGDGFAGGKQAQAMSDTANPIDAIQLGKGWNKQPKTLQVYDHQLMDADGNIPAERLKNAPAFKDVINVTINNSASWNWDDISELKTIYGNGSYLVNISAVGDNADCHDTALLITKSETTNSELDSGKYTQALITSDGAILYRESYWTMAGPQDWSKFKQIETLNIKDKLEDICNGGCVSATDCGLVGDGSTDNSSSIATMLQKYPNSTIYFPKGTYNFTSPIVFERGHVILDQATLKYTGADIIDSFISINGEIVDVANETPLGGMFFTGVGNSHQNVLDGNFKAKNIIRWTRQKGFQLKNIKVCNFINSGIQTKFQISGYTGDNFSYESHITDCYIENSLSYDSYGIFEAGGDAVIKNIVMLNVKKGILCGNAGTLYDNIHIWNYNWGYANKTASENTALMSGTMFADVTVDGCRFINCYLDTCAIGFNMRVGVNQILVSNAFWYINGGTWVSGLVPYLFYFVDGHNTEPRILMSQCNIDNGNGLVFSNKALTSDTAVLLNVICNATGTPSTPTANLTQFTNAINANNYTITNLPAPTSQTEVANKSYVDTVVQDAISALTKYVDEQIEDNLIEQVVCTGLTVSNTALTLQENGSAQTITATKEPADCTQQVRWSTSNASVASVVNGTVTPNGYGTCIITATCGSYQATCTVNVSYAPGVYAKNFTPTGTFSYDLDCNFADGQYVEVKVDVSKAANSTKPYVIFSLGDDISAWGSGYAILDYYRSDTGAHSITATDPTSSAIDCYPIIKSNSFVFQVKSDGIYINGTKRTFDQDNADTFFGTLINTWTNNGSVKFGSMISNDQLSSITEVTYEYIKVVTPAIEN